MSDQDQAVDRSNERKATLADALRAFADALEDGARGTDTVADAIARLRDDGANESESGDSSPEKAENGESGEFACTCGRTFASVHARNGHVGGSGPGHEAAESGDSSPEKPESGDSERMSTDAIREQADTSEQARELLRAHKYGREGWAVVFGTCAEPSCDFGCDGFEAERCSRHADEGADEGEAEPADGDGMSKPEYVRALMSDGVGAKQAHTMATEIFG